MIDMARRNVYTANVDQRFGRWIVLETELRLKPTASQRRNGEQGFRAALVRCDCGNEKTVRIDVLASGKSTSCGCYAAEISSNTATKLNTIHGLSLFPETKELFKLWLSIRKRIANPESKNYAHYGGRGIGMCRRWRENPAKFVVDIIYEIGMRPEGLELDRIDNEDDYRPGNVRWADRTTQNRNRRPYSQWKKHPVDCRCASCSQVRKSKGAV